MISEGISIPSRKVRSSDEHLSTCLTLLNDAFKRAHTEAKDFPNTSLHADLLAMQVAGNDQGAFIAAYSNAWAAAITTGNVEMVRTVEFIDTFRGVIREQHPSANLEIQ